LFNYNDYTEIIMVLPLMKRFITFQAEAVIKCMHCHKLDI